MPPAKARRIARGGQDPDVHASAHKMVLTMRCISAVHMPLQPTQCQLFGYSWKLGTLTGSGPLVQTFHLFNDYTIPSPNLPRFLPRFRILPAHIRCMVHQHQQAFAAIQKAAAKKICPDESDQRT